MEFVRFASFERSVAGVLSEDDILDLEVFLMMNPEAGDLIPGSRGLRKIRRPARSHGKRGGARVIYYHVTRADQILLLLAFAKNERSDLTPTQARQLGEIVKREFP